MIKTILFLAIFILGLCIYLPRATITPQNSDGAQFVSAAVSHSIIHQPGYPLYSLINEQIATFDSSLVFNNIAISSSIYQSLAASIFFLIGALLSKNLWLVFLGTISWLFFEPVGRTATDVEVFALHHLIIALVVYFSIQLAKSKKYRSIFSLLLGSSWALGIAHHHTIILWLPLSFIALIKTGANKNSPWQIKKFVCYSLIFFIPITLGFAAYLTLLFKSTSPYYPLTPPKNLLELTHYFLRTDFGTFSIGGGQSIKQSQFPLFIALALFQIPLLLLSPILIIKKLLQEKNPIYLSIFASLFFNILFAIAIIFPGEPAVINEWVTRFFGLVACSFLITYFLIIEYQQKLSKHQQILITLCLAIPLTFSLPITLNASYASKDVVIMEELLAIEREVPFNGVFITSSDRIAMGLSYLQTVERKREDLIVITPGLLAEQEYAQKLSDKLDLSCSSNCTLDQIVNSSLLQKRFIGAYHEFPPLEGLVSIPIGVVWQWVKPEQTINDSEIFSRLTSFCSTFSKHFDTIPKERKHSQLILERVFASPFVNFYNYLIKKQDFQSASMIMKIPTLVQANKFQEAKLLCLKIQKEQDLLSTHPTE